MAPSSSSQSNYFSLSVVSKIATLKELVVEASYIAGRELTSSSSLS